MEAYKKFKVSREAGSKFQRQGGVNDDVRSSSCIMPSTGHPLTPAAPLWGDYNLTSSLLHHQNS